MKKNINIFIILLLSSTIDAKKIYQNIPAATPVPAPVTEPETKVSTPKKLSKQVEKTLASVDKRSLAQDILTGYSPEQQTIAKGRYKILIRLEDEIKKKIEGLQTRLSLLQKNNNALSLKEQIEYDELPNRLKKWQESLQKVEIEILNQRVIAGEKWANSYKLLLNTGGVLAATAFYAGAGAGAILLSILAAQSKLKNASMVYGLAKNAYDAATKSPDTPEEELAKAKNELMLAKLNLEKQDQHVKTLKEKFKKPKTGN